MKFIYLLFILTFSIQTSFAENKACSISHGYQYINLNVVDDTGRNHIFGSFETLEEAADVMKDLIKSGICDDYNDCKIAPTKNKTIILKFNEKIAGYYSHNLKKATEDFYMLRKKGVCAEDRSSKCGFVYGRNGVKIITINGSNLGYFLQADANEAALRLKNLVTAGACYTD